MVFLKQVIFKFIALILCLAVYCNLTSCKSLDTSVNITFLNLGDSDSIIIKHNNRYIVVDTSFYHNYDIISETLGGTSKIDTLVLTHFDYDHIGAASKLIENKKIKSIYMPKINYNCCSKNYKRLKSALKNYKGNLYEVKESTFLKFGDLTITILPPKSDYYFFDNSNNSSLVLVLKYFNNSVFLGADICKDRVKEMLNDNEIEPHNILKIPHHGINFENSKTFYKKVTPEVSVTTCSTFRHLRIVSDNSLKHCGSLYFTDLGSVLLKMYKNGYSVNQL